jgi:hypothetical protein
MERKERESCSGALGKGMVDLNCVTVGGRRECINTPSGPNGQISAALDPRHCRSHGAALLHLPGQQWSRFE